MGSVAIFWMQLLVSCVVFAIGMAWYVWPSLTRLPRNAALTPLLWVHVPRYVGMTLLVTGMVDAKLPGEFLSGAAYGDLLEPVREHVESAESFVIQGRRPDSFGGVADVDEQESQTL